MKINYRLVLYVLWCAACALGGYYSVQLFGFIGIVACIAAIIIISHIMSETFGPFLGAFNRDESSDKTED